jgi:glutamate-1-semialdehyde 2,1-aminomutase
MSDAHRLFLEQYASRTQESARLFEEARKHLAGGVCGRAGTRSPHPLYVSRASGSKLVDVDGNEYIDCVIGGGPSILGHSAPAVMDAVKEQLANGTNTIAPPTTAVELAAKIRQHMPQIELLRFVHTGSEAVHMCIRAARAFTGRRLTGKFEGHYHGGLEGTLVSGTWFDGPEEAPIGVTEGSGVPDGVLDQTLVLPFNNTEACVALIERHAADLAAVIMEPVAGNWLGGVPAESSFLQALREVTSRHGIILIFDEVLTGFRLALGGAAEVTGVTPDLTALAKTIGGGFPLGAFGGRRDIMEAVVAPPADAPRHTAIFQSGTFQSNLVSLRAGLAMIQELEKPGVYERLNRAGEKIRNGINEIAAESRIPLQAVGLGSIYGIFFCDKPVNSLRDAALSDSAAVGTFALGMLANGIYTLPAHIGMNNLAQTDEDLDQIIDTARYVIKVMNEQ